MEHRLSVALGIATIMTGLTLGHEVHADTTISDLNFYASPFEAGSFSTPADYIGETFTTPVDNVLTNFTFVLDSSDGPIDLSIYGWDEANSRLVGNSLFTSAPNSGKSDIFGFYTYTYSFNIPRLPLTANGSYVALLHGTNGFVGLDAVGGTLFFPHGDPYPGGQYVFGVSPNSLVETNVVVPGFDLYIDLLFSAHFTSSVPEPGAYAMLGSLGLTGAAFLRRRRAR